MPKKKKTESDSPLRFEQALEQAQEIVSQLEDGSLGLEEALSQYEQGTALLRHCYTVLETAEQKIEQLTGFNEQGEPVCEPFDASATHDQKEQKAGRRKQVAKKKKAVKNEASDSEDETNSERGLF